MPRRYFTVERANRALPLVSRVVEDLTRTYEDLRKQQRDLRAAPKGDREDIGAQIRRHENELQRLLAELDSIGCELKSIEQGLLDFYAKKGEEIIYLCWMRGEDKVEFWHTLHGGVRGRRPIADLPAETVWDSASA
jgi:hypothetical protein